MNSYISHFKAWIAAAFVLLAIEGGVYALKRPSEFDRTNFLQFSFAKEETMQRLVVFDKIKSFADSEPAVLQVGDSSGFYGIDSRVVERFLPQGMHYLNMSCCANLGFNGYYNLAEFMFRRHTGIRYLVLYITPWTLPRPELWDSDGAALWGSPEIKVFGGAVYEEFLSVWRAFHLPSLGYRRQIAHRTYYLNGTFRPLDIPLLYNEPYKEFLSNYQASKGWTPETDGVGSSSSIIDTECLMETPGYYSLWKMRQESYIEGVFQAFADLAKNHGAKLVIVFQPVACHAGANTVQAEGLVKKFATEHPDVAIPFPLIQTWQKDLFSANPHIKRGHTDLVGNRLGQALSNIIEDSH